MQNNIKISVIIPAFNSENLIGRCIQSVLSQSFSAYEIIIVDDGSTDNTEYEVAKFGNYVQYIYQKNKGAGAARNLGAENANGDYLAFLDSDDIWYTNHLYDASYLFSCYPEIQWYGSAYNKIINGNKYSFIYRGNYLQNNIINNYFLAQSESNFSILHIDNLVVSKKTFFQVGQFDTFFKKTQDRILYFKLALFTSKLLYNNIPNTEYIIRSNSMISQYNQIAQPVTILSYLENLIYKSNHNNQIKGKLLLIYMINQKCNEAIYWDRFDILKKILLEHGSKLPFIKRYMYKFISLTKKNRKLFLILKRRLKIHLNVDL